MVESLNEKIMKYEDYIIVEKMKNTLGMSCTWCYKSNGDWIYRLFKNYDFTFDSFIKCCRSAKHICGDCRLRWKPYIDVDASLYVKFGHHLVVCDELYGWYELKFDEIYNEYSNKYIDALKKILPSRKL